MVVLRVQPPESVTAMTNNEHGLHEEKVCVPQEPKHCERKEHQDSIRHEPGSITIQHASQVHEWSTEFLNQTHLRKTTNEATMVD